MNKLKKITTNNYVEGVMTDKNENQRKLQEKRDKHNEYMRKWREKNPDKQREISKRYYKKHKKKLRKKHLKYYREHKEEILSKIRERYATDPEFKEKMKKSYMKWYEKTKTTRPSRLQPYTTGVKCICSFPIKCHTGGRFGKRIIKCPKCGMETPKNQLERVRIPREFPVVPANKTYTQHKYPKTSPKPQVSSPKTVSGDYPRNKAERTTMEEETLLDRLMKRIGIKK